MEDIDDRAKYCLTNAMYKLLFIAGARPNFMKISALTDAARAHADKLDIKLIHTGQHYDDELSRIFFDQFNMPEPHANLGVGSGSRYEQTQGVIEKLTPHLEQLKPDLVVVVGDVTSTIGATLAAVKKGIPVAHVEAGLRSGNWRMPEEINRVMCDHLSSLLFVTEHEAQNNLNTEGIGGRAHMVGNVMIDTLTRFEEQAEKSDVLEKHKLDLYKYALLTMHRPENVDNYARFKELFGAMCEINGFIKVVCPLHPRTKAASEKFDINWNSSYAPQTIPPVSYFDFLKLQRHAACVITDSGGIQEEASMFGVPCVTIRTETERPVTVTHGTNEVVGVLREDIVSAVKKAHQGHWKRRRAIIPYWDGNAAKRIMKIIVDRLETGITIPPHIAHYEKMAETLQPETSYEQAPVCDTQGA